MGLQLNKKQYQILEKLYHNEFVYLIDLDLDFADHDLYDLQGRRLIQRNGRNESDFRYFILPLGKTAYENQIELQKHNERQINVENKTLKIAKKSNTIAIASIVISALISIISLTFSIIAMTG